MASGVLKIRMLSDIENFIPELGIFMYRHALHWYRRRDASKTARTDWGCIGAVWRMNQKEMAEDGISQGKITRTSGDRRWN